MIKKTLLIFILLLLPVYSSSCSKDYPSDHTIFTLVVENEEVIVNAVMELLELETVSTIAFISTTQKSPISASDYEDIEGLYAGMHVDGNYIYVAMSNAAIEEMMKIRKLESVYVYRDRLQFNCGGRGIIPASINYGFVYAESDGFIGIGTQGVTEKGNGWLWREENGDNRYYTEKIIDYFYYYEARY